MESYTEDPTTEVEQIEPRSTLPRRRGRARTSQKLIGAIVKILDDIQPATVRAVAYQLFVKKLIRSMRKKNVKKVERLLKLAREDGTIAWEAIVDETREVEQVSTWDNPAGFARTVTRAYKKDKWAAQPYRVEVWSEKGTVRGTLQPILDQYEIPFRVMHGYASATAVHDAAEMIIMSRQPVMILYVGDWDPSGLHMSEVDLPKRLKTYGADPADFEITRVALTAGDLDDLPSFDAVSKKKDPRYQWFVERYGEMCWELDALSPAELRDRVETEIRGLLDIETWERYVRAESVEQASIVGAVSTWKRLGVRVQS